MTTDRIYDHFKRNLHLNTRFLDNNGFRNRDYTNLSEPAEQSIILSLPLNLNKGREKGAREI